jgi:hypothetical protein
MKRRVEDWSVEELDKERTRISFPEYQREKNLWPDEKKSRLIDSILRDIDIPKLYFNLLKDENIEVIDGQQRLWSIWQFLDNEYPYKVNGKGQLFSKMTAAQKQKIRSYNFQVTVFEEADDDYLRELFVRLQLGLLLNTGEKLHAATGRMKQLVFGKLADHPFIKHIGIPARRYAKQTLCAQICINSFTREKLNAFARTRYDDLLHFFSEYADPQGKDLELFKKESKKISHVMDQLWEYFGNITKDLRNRSYILSIYLFVEELTAKEGDLSAKEQKTFSNFVFRLWRRLREEMRLGIDRKNRELYSFETLLSSAPGEEYQIRRRHEKLSEYYNHFEQTGKIKGDK